MSMSPASRPQLPQERARAILAKNGVRDKVVIIGIRGYYRDTMGKPGVNDFGIYDDAIIVMTPTAYATFNANTDPSRLTPTVAVLKAGVHRYRKGKHGLSWKAPKIPYPALRPATAGERLPVTRGGKPSYGVAINIHRGSRTSTSSEGCQTIVPDQWDAFINLVYGELARYGQDTVPYVLIDGEPA